ncbi:MAG TPA: hypothetical protein PLD47_01930 [Aggregatilineales bacterium]|mgnify:CR=1 FL=1|nr:hypothetical protein [Anaerolineales bacterium]HRE46458.1 hypothetical protein [Aggregatilineales bacterium]
MASNLKTSIWEQFSASIEYLAGTIDAYPEELWRASLWTTSQTKPEFSQAWYVAYHTLFWLDLYLTGTEDGFLPPEPFTLIVHGHASQLNMLLGQKGVATPDYPTQMKNQS